MRKWVRRGLYLGLVLFPLGVWEAARAWGRPVSTWRLAAIPHAEGLFGFWALIWAVVGLGMWFSSTVEPTDSWRGMLKAWGLAWAVAALGSGYFVAVAWGTMWITYRLERRLPFLSHLETLLYIALFLTLLFGPLYLLMMIADLATPKETPPLPDGDTVWALVQATPLPVEVKWAYRDRLVGVKAVPLSTLIGLLTVAEAYPLEGTTEAQRAALKRLIATLRPVVEREV